MTTIQETHQAIWIMTLHLSGFERAIWTPEWLTNSAAVGWQHYEEAHRAYEKLSSRRTAFVAALTEVRSFRGIERVSYHLVALDLARKLLTEIRESKAATLPKWFTESGDIRTWNWFTNRLGQEAAIADSRVGQVETGRAAEGRRSLPFPKVELARRITGNTNARSRSAAKLFANRDLRPEGGNLYTICIDGLDETLVHRLTNATAETK